MLATLRNLARLAAIARALARHDALFPLEMLGVAPAIVWFARLVSRRDALGRPGQRLARALTELGPSFIKLGQALGTRTDLLGEEIADDLSDLQDRLPAFPGAEARAAIEAELDAGIEDLFERFDDTPVAAASIAQVHFAVTREGEEVAVKVLRPAIEDAFARDVALAYWIAELTERARPGLRRFKPVEVVRTFADTVALEMDLRYEAAAAAELAENLADEAGFRVPTVDWQRTARRVLTMARVSGIPIDEVDALKAAGHDLDAVLEKAARAFFLQVFRDGFFHADMHPGNLFVDKDGDIVAVDFGIMGRLDRETRVYLAEMLIGFLEGDYRRVAVAHFRAGYVPAHKSLDGFTQACRSIGEPILGLPLDQISIARLLGQLFQVADTFEMQVQPQLLLLQKTMLLAEGMGRRLNPALNMWTLTRPLMEAWARDHLGPEARLRHGAAVLARGIDRLPELADNIERAARDIATGGFKLHPETVAALAGSGRRAPNWPAWLALLIALLALAAVLVG